MQVYPSTPKIYTCRIEYTPVLKKHTTDLYKPCQAHPRAIQPFRVHRRSIDADTTPQVYIYKPCKAHPRSVQTISNTQQIYSNSIKHTLNLHKVCKAHPWSIKQYPVRTVYVLGCISIDMGYMFSTTCIDRRCARHPVYRLTCTCIDQERV